jgi:imidazolonepropionase-like amidohydrolase
MMSCGLAGWRSGFCGMAAVALFLAGCTHSSPPISDPVPFSARRTDDSPPAAPIAIVGALLWTGDAQNRRIEHGTIIVRNGVIEAIGDASLTVPQGVQVIDAGGRWVTPGLIDAHSHLGVYPVPAVTAHEDGNELTDPVTPDLQAMHSFWPQDPALSHARAAGVTSMLILPGSGNLIGGRGFSVKNRPARSAEGMRFPGSPDVLKMACGENPKRVYGNKSGPASRMGNLARVRGAYLKAKDYAARWTQWERTQKAKGEKPPERDLKLETLVDVMAGKIQVQNHCYRADEMLLMLDIAREMGFTIRAFHHAVEAYKIADVLAAEGVAVATWADWWGFKMEAYDGIQENLALVHAAGGRAIVHSDSPIGIQHLNLYAAQGLAVGREMGLHINEDDALTWITRNPAWAMGVQAQTGSLEVGKMADLVLWSGHPLSIYSKPDRVFVDGHPVFERNAPANKTDFEMGTVP